MIDTQLFRSKILSLALSGKLTKQNISDGDARDLAESIREKKGAKNKLENIEDIPYEIPSNWCWMSVSDFGTLSSGKPYEELDSGVLYVKVGDMNLPGNEKNITTSRHFVSKNNAGIVQVNSIIFPKRGGAIATNKKRSVIDCPIFIDLNTMALTVDDAAIFPFVKMWFDSLDLSELQTGTSIPQINNKDIYPLIMPLPPLAEQKRIVDLVNKAFEILDDVENIQSQYALDLEVLKTKIIDAGIQGKLTEQLSEDGTAEELFEEIRAEKQQLIKDKKIKKEKALPDISEEEIPFEIPSNWKWVRLADLCSKISSGNTPAGGSKGGAYVNEGYCFFREQNIYNDGIHYDGMVYITEELLATRENSTVLPQDILLNITGGSIGRCALIPDDFSKGSINQHILIIRVIDPRIRFYIHKCLCSPYYQKLIMGNVVGDKDGFSAGRCKNTLIPLPPIAEQVRIVAKMDELLSLI